MARPNTVLLLTGFAVLALALNRKAGAEANSTARIPVVSWAAGLLGGWVQGLNTTVDPPPQKGTTAWLDPNSWAFDTASGPSALVGQ